MRRQLRALALRWHFHVFYEVGDIVNQRALGAVTGVNINSFIAPFQSGFPVIEPETALRLFGTVTAETGGFEDRSNVTSKFNRIRGGRRQFGDIYLGGEN